MTHGQRLLVALLVAMAVTSGLVLAWGASPLQFYGTLLGRTWGEPYGFGQVLFKATPLLFTGLSVALAFRAGLFNIGAEGQLLAGSLAMGVVGVQVGAWPGLVAVPLCLAAGALAGAGVATVPAVLKARFGAHEVISTIMMNFITGAAVMWIGRHGGYVDETVHTAAIGPGAVVPSLGIEGSAASIAFLGGVVLTLVAEFGLNATRIGFEWRALGAQPEAAEAGGVDRARLTFTALVVAGAVAGLVGSGTVLGYKGYFEDGLGSGSGFMGIAVALLAGSRPWAILPAALVMGTLSHGSLAASGLVPREIVDVIQGVVVLAVALTQAPPAGGRR